MSEALNNIQEFSNQVLNDLLAQCTKEQQAFFKRLYPNGVPEDSLRIAIMQCERTITKNKRMG